jgi:hypothetical protein
MTPFALSGRAKAVMKRILQLAGGCAFDHLRQRFRDLVLCVIEVTQLLDEQLLQAL